MKPKDAMVRLLRDHNGEMAANELYDLLLASGAFEGRVRPPSAFRTSLAQNVKPGTIVLIDAAGEKVAGVDPTLPFSHYTVRLGDGKPFNG